MIFNYYRCKRKCFEQISDEEKLAIMSRFYNLGSKDEQDVFIQGLINQLDVKQRRVKEENLKRKRNASFKYHILLQNERKEVCYNAFLSLLSVTDKRVKRIRNLLLQAKSPRDLRGKNSSANAFPEQVRMCVYEHINSFPVKQSHYSDREFNYLDSNLNLTMMYHLYKEKYPTTEVSYSYYCKFFNENFKLSFGRPQVDVCSTCEQLNIKIRNNHLSEAVRRCAAGELIVHKRRSKKFYTALKEESQNKDAPNILALCFDFMQNIQLPVTPVGEVFYYNQLTMNVFCIHNIKENHATFYVYHEGTAKKTPNEVCSFLLDYISQQQYKNFEELRLYSDNCWGQNKNHSIIRLLLSLTDNKRFQKIQHYFPMRGHSFLPCDRNFAVIKRALKKHDRLYTVHQVTEVIATSSRQHKFTVKEVSTHEIRNFKDYWPKFYKKTCTSEETCRREVPRERKIQFNISNFHYFEYNGINTGVVVVSDFINGFVKHTFNLGQPGKLQDNIVPPHVAYPLGKVPIKEKKMEGIKKCVPFVDDVHKAFYEDIIQWPIAFNNKEDDD